MAIILRGRLRAAALVALIWALLNLPLLLGFRVLPGDAMDDFYAMVYFNVHSIHQGLAPWWNPYIFSGYPQIADPQAMLFSPLFMAWMLLNASPGVTWFVWGELLHLLMGGIAMQLFLSRTHQDRGLFGSLLGAAVFMAGGVVAGRLQHVPIICAYAYVPLILLTLHRFIESPSLKRGALVGVFCGAMLTMPSQVAFLFALLVATYGGALVWVQLPYMGHAQRLKCVFGLSLCGTIAVAIALPQAVFTWAFLMVSNRPTQALAESQALNTSLDFRALWTLLNPNALQALRGTYTGPASPNEGFLYIGAVPVLVLIGLGRAWRFKPERWKLFFFSIASIVAVLYMCGPQTPLYAWAYRWVPGISEFRRPSDAAFILNFGLAYIVGISAMYVDFSNRPVKVGLALAATAWLVISSLQMRGHSASWQVASIAAALAAAISLWRLAPARSTASVVLWLLAVTVADYRSFNLNGEFNHWHDNAKRFLKEPASHALAGLIQSRALIGEGLPPRFESVDAGIVWKNNNVLLDLPATQGYGPLKLALYDRFYGAYADGNGPRPISAYNLSPGSKINQLLGVQFLVATKDWVDVSGGDTLAFGGAKINIYAVAQFYPRVLTPASADILPVDQVPSPEAMAQTNFMLSTVITPRSAADAVAAKAVALECTGAAKVNDASQTNVSVSLRIIAPTRAWIVLSNVDAPGWRADADGKPLQIFRANGMFQAVCTPAGDTRVKFTFHPFQMVRDVVGS